jgi:glycosyltransferase involved in cell wall biosynthesis
MPDTASASVVIPAHNEEAVIGRCLDALLRGAATGELEVVVVCNGCADRTASVAREHAGVKVIETDVASKSHALNLGDRTARAFPRFYVDADVTLPIESLREVARVLREGPALAAAPLLSVDLSQRSWAVRGFYDVWLRLPYCRSGMIGSGVYAVSEEGRRRFGPFPPITADDAFARFHFAPAERHTVEQCRFWITAPSSVGAIIKIKTRSHFGNVELRRLYPNLHYGEDAAHSSALPKLMLDPRRWPGLAVYAYVKLATRLRVMWRYRGARRPRWERDEGSRQPAAAAVAALTPPKKEG